MQRRPRIDLGGQDSSLKPQASTTTATKDEARLERKRKRWAIVNKNRPADENPFLAAIKPDHDNYGDIGESAEELRTRLASLEFGNYPGYFNYRNKAAVSTNTTNDGQAADKQHSSAGNPLEAGLNDERLRLMKKEWFENKSVLDVGCNRGHITYAIAKLFSPKFILGIDIDLKMVHMANRDLHLHLEDELIKKNLEFRIDRACKLEDASNLADKPTTEPATSSNTTVSPEHDVNGDCRRQYVEDESQHFPLSSYVAQGPLATAIMRPVKTNCDSENKDQDALKLADTSEIQQGSHDENQDKNRTSNKTAENVTNSFPNNILFVEHNYVLSKDELVDKQKAFFDTIVCLSVTKWIHLNYRDDGLKRFLKRMYKHLNEGGLLILEVQPFDNYHRKKKLSDRLRSNFNSIKFRPEQIDDYLLSDEVGFKRIVFSTTTEHECLGFKRPMKVFLK
jgi:2-polyprenyl-3-methyl-5-hydroxy-6-metoxy-1,4-benzoquinol methylase